MDKLANIVFRFRGINDKCESSWNTTPLEFCFLVDLVLNRKFITLNRRKEP